MKALVLALALAPALASAQVQASASFSIDLPVVLPQLVVIQPGIQVVPGVDVEVFQVDGFFWTHRNERWYRSKSHRGGWVYMDRGVPPGLRSMPPGKYRRWKPVPAARVGEHVGHDGHSGDRQHAKDKEKDKGGKGHGKKD